MEDEQDDPDVAQIQRDGLTVHLWDEWGKRDQCNASVHLPAAVFSQENRLGLCVESTGDDVHGALHGLAWRLDEVSHVLGRCGQREGAAVVVAMRDRVRRLPDELGWDVTIDEVRAMSQIPPCEQR